MTLTSTSGGPWRSSRPLRLSSTAAKPRIDGLNVRPQIRRLCGELLPPAPVHTVKGRLGFEAAAEVVGYLGP